MPEISLKGFDQENFKPDDFVKNLVEECVAGSELQQRKIKLQSVSDQVSSSLKKHVFENYMQFIETAKEISHLESEMYQLSHILVEQRNLLSSLREESLLEDQKDHGMNEQGNPDENEQDYNKKAIASIKETLMGYSGTLDNKTLIHRGPLIELDGDDYRPIRRSHLFLFNDILIISKLKNEKLEFMAEYETKKVALINIKDRDGIRNAVNLMTNDGSKIFQCVSSAAKNEWMEKFEISFKQFNQQSATGTTKSKKGPAPQPPKVQKQKSLVETQSISSDMTLSPTASILTENWAPEWVYAAPEEIQAQIAQRHFEDSLALIQKCEDFLQKNNSFYNCQEIVEKTKGLKSVLSGVLLHELSNTQSSRNLQVLRSSRRLLKLLVEMGKGREACTILLKVCTTAIRTSQRQARRNNLQVSELFFCDLATVASEFLRAFNSQIACTSALVVWCNTELQYFASQLIKHYLTKGTPLESVAKTVQNVREPCAKLTEIGLDLSYYMEGLIRGPLEQLIEESRFRLIETIGRTEESWVPYNLQTKSNLRQLLKEINVLGIDMNSFVTGDTFINLTQSTVNFCRHFLSVTESCASLGKNEILKPECENLLKDLFLAQHKVKPSGSMSVDLNFVTKNKNYLMEVLLPAAITKFEKISEHKSRVLLEMQTQLKGGVPKPKPRNVYKTDVI